jgi:hypothetical protein
MIHPIRGLTGMDHRPGSGLEFRVLTDELPLPSVRQRGRSARFNLMGRGCEAVCEELHSGAMNLSRFVTAMPLYYLHIRTGNKLEIDLEGVELPSRAAALSEA